VATSFNRVPAAKGNPRRELKSEAKAGVESAYSACCALLFWLKREPGLGGGSMKPYKQPAAICGRCSCAPLFAHPAHQHRFPRLGTLSVASQQPIAWTIISEISLGNFF